MPGQNQSPDAELSDEELKARLRKALATEGWNFVFDGGESKDGQSYTVTLISQSTVYDGQPIHLYVIPSRQTDPIADLDPLSRLSPHERPDSFPPAAVVLFALVDRDAPVFNGEQQLLWMLLVGESQRNLTASVAELADRLRDHLGTDRPNPDQRLDDISPEPKWAKQDASRPADPPSGTGMVEELESNTIAEDAAKWDESKWGEGVRGDAERIVSPAPPQHTDESDTAEITVRRDDAEREHDSLGRAPLAISLAWTLHEIWCTEQGLRPYPPRYSDEDAAAFVAHIDAPWGGGKTTFANLLARTLNPGLDGHAPAFLKALYPDREDMSGLFIRDTHQPANLKDGAGEYRWQEEARRPWIVVEFNAWRHAHVDPPWWCFYQAIRKGCFAAIGREGVPQVRQETERSARSWWSRRLGGFRVFGIGFRRLNGVGQTTSGRYSSNREGQPMRRLRWLRLWAREIVWRLTSDRLMIPLLIFGLSVAVGFWLWDAGALQVREGKPVLATPGGIGLVLTFLLGTGAFVRAAVTVVVDALMPGRAVPGERVSLGAGDPIARFRRHFAAMMTNLKRPVLVIIDDIDRCKPDFIVDLTRGLQTILKSPRVVYLVLGDRQWIEKAFEVRHQEMSGIDVGPEHSFGGRFVQKAIQLSFVLPAMADHKEAYVREVLLGRTDADRALEMSATPQPAKISPKSRAKLRGVLTEAESVEDIDTRASILESEAPMADEPGRRKAVREEVILERAARKEQVQQAIRHRLQPLAPCLPGNPRHIKRIINAISMYQDSLLLMEESLAEAGIGKRRWRQLVIGVVMMMGYPKSWSLLARDPQLVEDLLDGVEPKTGKAATERDQNLAHLRANPMLAYLLSKTRFQTAPGEAAAETRIDAEAVGWLNRLIPTRG